MNEAASRPPADLPAATGRRTRPTMIEVAESAGVSLKTVSRVVNGEAGVSPALATRVQAAIEALDYRPNIGASTLRRSDRRTATIGLLLEDVGNPFSASLHRAVEDEARPRGVQVLTGSLDEDPIRERELARAFTMRRADGLILAPASPDQSYLKVDVEAGTPVVFVDRSPVGLAADAVLTTNVTGATEAVGHLVSHGHRRIACLGDYARIATAADRHRGYRNALDDRGLPYDRALVVRDLHDSTAAEAAVMALLRQPDPPTALFTSQNLVTIGAVRALRRLGRHHDVALVGFDDFPLADLLEPGVTVVSQNPALMGQTAARALFARIDGDTEPPREHWIPTTLIRRGSGEIRPGSALIERRGTLPL
jgi:LacI family transcriptional regulator